MSSRIVAYFAHLEQRLLESEAVSSYSVVQREVTSVDGKIRIRARLRDEGLLELFEYITVDVGEIIRLKYAYHWQDSCNCLVRRWDAVRHYPDLPNAPHHIHLSDGSVEGVADPPDAFKVLEQIEAQFEQEQSG